MGRTIVEGHEIPADRIAKSVLRKASYYEKHPNTHGRSTFPNLKAISRSQALQAILPLASPYCIARLFAVPPPPIPNLNGLVWGTYGCFVVGYGGMDQDEDGEAIHRWLFYQAAKKHTAIRSMSHTRLFQTLTWANSHCKNRYPEILCDPLSQPP